MAIEISSTSLFPVRRDKQVVSTTIYGSGSSGSVSFDSSISGVQGVQGIQGRQGTTGSQGITGLGFTWKDLWDDIEYYNVNDVVYLSGTTYVCILANDNVQPPNATYWRVMSVGAQGTQGIQGRQGTTGSDGDTGDTGTQGTQGTQGIQGRQGITGSQGTTGDGLVWEGTWDDTTSYEVNDLAYLSGTTYICILANNNVQPPNSSYWDILSTGTQGTQGIQGRQGAQGIQGITGNTGPDGPEGDPGVQGTTGAQGIQGRQGTTGAQGIQGRQGTTGAQGTIGAQGIQGIQGRQGTTGAQGAQGTQGVQGRQGIQGAQGTQGIQGPSGSGLSSFAYKTSGYILTAGDLNNVVEASGNIQVILPNSLSNGFNTTVINVGGGTITIAAGTGSTIFAKDGSLDIVSRYGAATTVHKSSGNWYVFGDLQ